MFGEGNSPVRAPERPLVDPFGRAITYLRVSVTDRCDFRCVYCMAEDMTFLPKNEVLSLEEIDRIASAFIRRGTRKLPLTGGEPLVRRGITAPVNNLCRPPNVSLKYHRRCPLQSEKNKQEIAEK